MQIMIIIVVLINFLDVQIMKQIILMKMQILMMVVVYLKILAVIMVIFMIIQKVSVLKKNYGCMNEYSSNYISKANLDDNSCK